MEQEREEGDSRITNKLSPPGTMAEKHADDEALLRSPEPTPRNMEAEAKTKPKKKKKTSKVNKKKETMRGN